MNSMHKYFQFIARLEGISYLLLLCIAMPLKYVWNFPEAVKYVGWAHGMLFMMYAGFLPFFLFKGHWTFSRTALAFVASLLPFGPFIFDKKYLG